MDTVDTALNIEPGGGPLIALSVERCPGPGEAVMWRPRQSVRSKIPLHKADETMVRSLQMLVHRRALHGVRNNNLLRGVCIEEMEQHRVLTVVFELRQLHMPQKSIKSQ